MSRHVRGSSGGAGRSVREGLRSRCKRRVALLVAATLPLAGVALPVVSGLGAPAAAASNKTVTIAVIDPLTGQLAPDGQRAVNGAKAGAAYLNAGNAKAKGIHYNVISRNSTGSPTVDEALARQLTQQGVRYFLGDDLTSTGYAAEQTAFNPVHAISFSSVPGVFPTGGTGTPFPNVYGDGGSDSHYVVPFVNYFKKAGVKKLAVLYANYQDIAKWGQQAVSMAKKDGMSVSTQAVALTATTVTAQLRTLQSSGADALLVYALLTTLAGDVAQGLNQIGWSPKVDVLEGLTAKQVSELPAASQGSVLTGPASTTFLSTSPNAQPTGLAASYFKYYAPLAGEKKGSYDTFARSGSYYFDAMLIIDQAIAKAKSTTTQKVEKALNSGTKFVASGGVYVYGPKNRVGPVTSDFGVYKLTAAGCPTGVCQKASS